MRSHWSAVSRSCPFTGKLSSKLQPTASASIARRMVSPTASDVSPYPLSRSIVTGRCATLTIRRKLSIAKVSGTRSPSVNPFASATDQLLVATALAPPAATVFAMPASQTLKTTSGFPGTCSAEIVQPSASDPSSSRHCSRLPVCAQLFIEFLPTFFREENSRTF